MIHPMMVQEVPATMLERASQAVMRASAEVAALEKALGRAKAVEAGALAAFDREVERSG